MQFNKIIILDSEIGASTRGASLGPEALKIASIGSENAPFKTLECIYVGTENDALFQLPAYQNAKYIDQVIPTYERMSIQIRDVLLQNENPFVLTGDHSSGGAIITGLKKAFPDQKIGIIWIDAHADLHTPYTSPSGNMHGMPLGVAMGLSQNPQMQRNQVSPEVSGKWMQLLNACDKSPMIKGEDICFLGLRDFEKEEREIINDLGIEWYSVESCRKYGLDGIMKKVVAKFSGYDKLFISFDVDSLDDSISKGTGTSVPNGFSENEMIAIFNTLKSNPILCCVEVTEINPLLDDKNKMAEAAWRILGQSLFAR
jgi:arginase